MNLQFVENYKGFKIYGTGTSFVCFKETEVESKTGKGTSKQFSSVETIKEHIDWKTKTVNDSIQELLRDYDSLFQFYRAIYKSVPCGPMVGFKIDDKWLYGDDLNTLTVMDIQKAEGVSISSIVEGSDIEIEGDKFTEAFHTKDFYLSVDRVNEEASFYWERDNSAWYDIMNHEGDYLAQAKWTNFENAPEFINAGDLDLPTQEDLIKFIKDNCDEISEKAGARGLDGMDFETVDNQKFTIKEFENDAVYL